RFIREYSSHRDFFSETTISGKYTWSRFYYKEIKRHFYDKHGEYFEDDLEQEQQTVASRESGYHERDWRLLTKPNNDCMA
ncbi:MAG: hypothetical protein HOE92_08125, partial [Euryarchaeota archaeon]|nr:hypothetical protein [Euryarchaeota archaeon]